MSLLTETASALLARRVAGPPFFASEAEMPMVPTRDVALVKVPEARWWSGAGAGAAGGRAQG